MIAAHMRGSADSGSVQRTQIAFPLENALAVLKALEGCAALVISFASNAGKGETVDVVFTATLSFKELPLALMLQLHHTGPLHSRLYYICEAQDIVWRFTCFDNLMSKCRK